MIDQFEIEIQRPLRSRRGDLKVVIVVVDSHGKELFRDRADLNAEKIRIRVAERIADITGDSADTIAGRLLDKLGQIPPPAASASIGTSPGAQPDPYPYEATPGGLLWNKETSEGIVPIPLTTFTALIVGQVVEDDGAETRRLLEIEATLWGRTYRIHVPAGQFTNMNWPMEHLGAAAALWPGFGTKDHARAAIQFLSGDPPERMVYAHLGWREIDGAWYYLHAGGAIGPMGPVDGIEVSLPPDLQRYYLPAPATGTDLIKAIHPSLKLLDVAGDKVTVPVYCGLWRAVLGACDLGVHLEGQTGAGKTELAALAQQHYGAEMGARNLPGSWLSTENALETLAFVAKDALLVVDDFCPTGSQYDVQAMHRKADRIFRGQGNAAGRGRLRPDGTLRPTKPPRGMVLSTGEDVPKGQSLRARVMVVEVPQVGAGAMDWGKLTSCQVEAAAGQHTQVMAGFLRWLAPQYGDMRRNLQTKIADLRAEAHQGNQHRRTPDIVANLAVGIRYFLDFAQQVSALDQIKSEVVWGRCWSALKEAAATQQAHQADSDPVNRFLELLGSAVSSGRAYLSDNEGDPPELAASWGWREALVGSGDFTRTEWRPQGEHVGWLVGGEIYLQADATYAVVQRLARDGGDQVVVTLATLKKRLKQRGKLASIEKSMSGGREVERLEVRKMLQGKRRKVLHLRSSSMPYTPSDGVPSVPSAPNLGGLYLAQDDDGAPNGTQIENHAAEVLHESAPSEAVHVPGQSSSGALGTHGTQITIEDHLGEERNAVLPSDPWVQEV